MINPRGALVVLLVTIGLVAAGLAQRGPAGQAVAELRGGLVR